MANFVNVLLENWQQALVGGAIVISAVIVLMGMIKGLFDKIPYKLLRKFLLALTSVVLVLPVSAIYFVCAGIDYKYFWGDYALLSVATIVTYWLYENTCLRDLIHKIGSLTLGRFIKFLGSKFMGNSGAVTKEELKDFTDVLEADVHTEMNSAGSNFLPVQKEEEKIRIPISTTPVVKLTPSRSFELEQNELKKL